jgi:hypothetical protein
MMELRILHLADILESNRDKTDRIFGRLVSNLDKNRAAAASRGSNRDEKSVGCGPLAQVAHAKVSGGQRTRAACSGTMEDHFDQWYQRETETDSC